MDAARRLVHSVQDLSGPATKGEVESAYWSEAPAELVSPRELAEVGFAVVGATSLPTVKRGGAEAALGELLADEEIDPRLSTTGRLAANAPFQVISDGTYVVVLRQLNGGHRTVGGCDAPEIAPADVAPAASTTAQAAHAGNPALLYGQQARN
ncbi:hypothetical protein OG495_36195 [Streptomyces longwoodensis]|uniref:hypothetical protein n=1 Tax=Streptomyces longwoodensis TaxID=68231 RepID=UPI0038662FEB